MNQPKQSHPGHSARPQRHGRQQSHPAPPAPGPRIAELAVAPTATSRPSQPTTATKPNKSATSSTRDRLEFFSHSPDAPPGQGRGEHVRNPSEYADLAKIKAWRSILSNFDMTEFEWIGYTWSSIEHAYQGTKMLVSSQDAFVAFSKEGKVQQRKDGGSLEQAVFGNAGAERIDEMRDEAEMMQRIARTAKGKNSAGATRGSNAGRSSAAGQGSMLSTSAAGSGYPHIGVDTALAARQARLLVQLSIDQADFWTSVSKLVMLDISWAKYAQSPLSQRVLLATGDAQLSHRVDVDDPLVRFDHLETIREEMRQQAHQGGEQRGIAKHTGATRGGGGVKGKR